MVIHGTTSSLDCPIMDTEECRHKEVDGKRGELLWWGQKEYDSFVIAFLSNRAFVNTFIDKQKLEVFNQDPENFLQKLEKIKENGVEKEEEEESKS